MITLYKYINKKYAKKFLEEGEILISSLSAFHQLENKNSQVGDRKDGVATFFSHGRVFDSADRNCNQYLEHFVREKIQANQIVLNFEKLTINIPDCFIFSVSKIFDMKIGRQMDKSYDTCIKIYPFEDFFHILTDCLIRSGYSLDLNQAQVKDCLYIDKDFDLSSKPPDSPVFLKSKKYQYQAEVRCVWIIKNFDKERMPINCPEIRRFCSLMTEGLQV